MLKLFVLLIFTSTPLLAETKIVLVDVTKVIENSSATSSLKKQIELKSEELAKKSKNILII